MIVMEKFPSTTPNTTYMFVRGDVAFISIEKIKESPVEWFVQSIIHEVIHSYTVNYYNNNKLFKEKMDALYEEAKSLSSKKDMYGFKNAKEFMSEIYSNPIFQEEIKSLDRSVNDSIWTKFVNLIKELLGFKVNKNSLFDEAYLATTAVIEHNKNAYNEAMNSDDKYNTFYTALYGRDVNYQISDEINAQTIEDLRFVNKDLFTAQQQDEVIDSILYQVQQYRLAGLDNVNRIKESVYNDFKETSDYFKEQSDDDYSSLITSIDNVLANYDKFFEKVNKKLASQDITVDTNDTSSFNNEESTYDSAENLNQKLNYSDESSFKQSTKDTASANLKIALSLIPKYVYENGKIVLDEEGNPEVELSFIGSPTFESLDSIWNDLLYTLVNVPIGQKLNYLKQSENPKHNMIAQHILDNPDISIQNQFESVFSKQQANFVTVSYSRPDKNGIKSIRVMDTNRMNADNLLIDNWYEAFLDSDYIISKEGNKEVNTTKGKQLYNEFVEAVKTYKTNKDKGLRDIKNTLGKIGINISMKALNSDGIWSNRELITVEDIISNKLKYIFNSLAGDTLQDSTLVEDSLELNNPFIDENSTLELLAKLENKVNPTIFEASYVSGDGKAKYSFVNNTYASLKVRQLKTDVAYLNKLKNTAYASGSFYLNKLINDPSFRDIFDLRYVDTLGNDSVNQPNKTFARMNTKEKELTKISLFQNAGKGTTNAKSDIGKFIGLVPSDKTTTPLFNTLKVDVKVGNNVNAQGNLTFNQDTMEAIYSQFVSEYNRVKQTFAEIGNPDVKQILEYHTGAQLGRRFIVFPFLNKVLIQNNQLLELDDTRLEELVKPELQKFLTNLTNDQIDYWKSLDIYPNINNYTNFFDKSYAKKVGMSLSKNIDNATLDKYAKAFAANYAINQFIFMMNQTQLFSGDPALHGKSVIRDGDVQEGKSIDKTWINFYKRMAKDIAPGTDGNFGENASFNTIFLKDLNYESANLMNYMEKVSTDIGQEYAKINPADAQEYTTLDEHANVMRAYGRLDSKAEEAIQRLKDGGTDINDIKLILQPMKPVYVTGQIEGGINVMYYIKSSSFPLIPAMTKGLEIDKLRQVMESKDIQRAAYESAVKLGLQGQLNEVSNDGGIEFNNLDIKPDQIINLTRDGFRLQQEMPYHGDHPHINEGSQGRKLILNNLPNTDIINYNGKQYSGREVKDIFENLHIERMSRSLDKLTTDLGFNLETGKLEDVSKIQKIIQEEAESRNYPLNDLYSIQLIKENGKNTFKVPISFSNNATRFESILNSLFTNRVIKSELPGFMGIQGASSGFSKVMTDEAISDSIIESGITWINPSDTKLNYIREDENGVIQAADILVPNYIRDKAGNQVDLKNYIKEDGSLDTDRFPEDLLTIIGLRIPTQGYNSMMKFKVKGFLPNIVGDLVIVPAEVTIQMGSDFDVDKLFIYRYNYNMDKGGNLSKVTTELPDNATDIDYNSLSEEQIENLIIQTFEDRLSDKNMMEQILTPNGFGKLPSVANEVAKLSNTKTAVHTFTTREQNSISDINVAGKMGTAVFSLFSTFFKAAQDANLKLTTPFVFKNSKGQVEELDSLSEITNIEGTKRSDVIMYLQSAAVDNSKEQILGKLNINDYTMGVAGTMAMVGLDDEFIGYFLSQPILKEFSKRVASANDIVSGTSDPNASARVVEELERTLYPDSLDTDLLKMLKQIPFGVKELKSYLETGDSPNLPTNLTAEELDKLGRINNYFEFLVLNNFNRFLELAENIQTLQSATNLDTKGLGATYGAIQAKSIQLNNVLQSIGKEFYPIKNAENLFEGNTVQKANETLIKANNLLGQVYTYNSASYINIINDILKNSNLSPTENNLKDIYANMKSFILTNPNLLDLEEINTVRDSLLYGKDNISKRWLEYSNSPIGKRNPLTKRILPKFAKNKEDYNGLKSINTPASNNSYDIDNAVMYFYEMLNSDNTSEKQLAEDIVKYHILTGASYSPQSIGKYISFDVLEKYDFSKKLRDIDNQLKNSQLFTPFVKQYFQNNPFKALNVDVKSVFKLNKIPDTLSIPIKNNPARNSDNKHVKYFSTYDETTRTPILFELESVSPDYLEYVKVPILGNKFIKKYDYLDNSEALEVENREDLPMNVNPIMQALRESNSPSELFINEYGDSVNNILTNISNNSSNAYFKLMASDLLSTNSLNDVNVEFSDERLANGWYTNNTVYLNPNAILRNGKSNANLKFEEVFLHELLHAGTVKALNNFNNLEGVQKVAANKIARLFDEYRKNENQEELNKYIDINNRRLSGENISESESIFLQENKGKLYPLTNINEFVAAGLTNPEFRSTLKNKNLWEKLLDFIGKLLNIPKNDLHFLYENTIQLVETGSDSQISEDLYTDYNTEHNRIEFVKQRDEFLRAHKTSIGKKITDATLKKFQESQKSKDKYDRLKISSWNGELRISRVDPVYEDISDSPVEKENPKARAINSLIARYKESLKKLNYRKRQLGDEVNPVLDNKIADLQAKLESLTAENSVSNYMSVAESKVNEIASNIDNYNNIDDVNDALTYTSALKGVNSILEFTEEFDEWNTRLDSISAKATKLNKKLLNKGAKLLSDRVKENIDVEYDISKALNKGVKEIGYAESKFLDYSQSSSEDIQIIGNMIEKLQFDANQEHDSFVEEFLPLIEAYKKDHSTNYNQLLQLDSKGKPTGYLVNKYSQEFYDKTKGNYKFFIENTDISLSEENLARYERDKKFAYDNLSPDDFLSWEAQNNPNTFIKSWNLGEFPRQSGAKRYVKITPKDKWLDPNYTKLKSLGENSSAVKLYNFIEPILRSNNKRYGQQSNYIPELAKSPTELMLEGKAKDAIAGLKQELVDSFSGDLSYTDGDIDILTGEPRLYIPVQMYANKVDADKKSYDLAMIAEKVKFQEITLKYKYEAEPVLNLYYTILKNAKQFLKYDEDGNPVTTDKTADKLVEHSQFLIQNYLYNKNRSINDTEKLLGKATDKIIDYARLVGMGWNPFSAVGNIMQGLTSNFTFADGRFFNKEQYTKATGIMMHSLAGNTDTAKKTSSLFKKFDTFVKTNELNYGKSKELATATQSKLRDIAQPYDMQQRGEYFIQGQTMIGILLNTKHTTPDGTEISLYEGYNKDGKWNSKYGVDPMKDKKELFKMTQKIRKAIIDVHGNYARPIAAKQDFYFRAAMMFRTWLPQAIHNRFGSERTDILTKDTTKGRYRSYASMFKDSQGKFDLQGTLDNLKWWIGLSKNSNLTELDKANMRRNLTELAMIAAVTLAIAALKAGLKDLDDEDKTYTNYIINTLSRTNSDLTFFLLPSSANTILQDPIPLMKTIQNTIDILPATWNYIIDEDEYQSGFRKGDSKLGKEIRDVIPFVTQVDKNITYMNQVFDK